MTLLPRKMALEQSFQMASTIESAVYLVDRLEICLNKARVQKKPESIELMKLAKNNVENVTLQRMRNTSPWIGNPDAIKTDFGNMQQNTFEKGIATLLAGDSGDHAFTMNLAISDESQFIRGYLENGNPPAAEQVFILDKTFNAWLAGNDMVSLDSIIYECDADGEIVKDKAGNMVKVPAEKLKQLIGNNKSGPQKLITDKGVDLAVQLHRFPERIAEKAPAKAASAAKPATPAAPAKPDAKPDTTPAPEEGASTPDI